jgi:hypothetical protein
MGPSALRLGAGLPNARRRYRVTEPRGGSTVRVGPGSREPAHHERAPETAQPSPTAQLQPRSFVEGNHAAASAIRIAVGAYVLLSVGGRRVSRSGGDDHQTDSCRSGRCPRWARPCCWGHDCPGHRRWWRPECGPGCRWEVRGALLWRIHVRHCAAGVAGQLLRAVRAARPWVIVWPRGWLGIRTGREPVLPVRRVQRLTNARRQGRVFAARDARHAP